MATKVELPAGVLAVRAGPGANCSSIGSVVDILFGTAVAAGLAYALIATSLGDEKVEIVNPPPPPRDNEADE
jgi:hypothetical protein